MKASKSKEKNVEIEKSDHQEVSLVILISLFIILFIILRRAWMTDDAYITLRTVDNFVNGFGLTWNIAERVQVFTHPLWMFVLSAFYFFTREPYYTTIYLSVFFTLFSIVLLFKYFAKSTLLVMLATTVLALSRAFVDYSTSGLENPLSYLLVIIFFIIFLYHLEQINHTTLVWLSLIASLGILNRMDYFLIFILPLLYCLWLYHDWKGTLYLLLGQIPFLVWEVFSFLYYGYLVPNTAFAKLGYGFAMVVLKQGMTYFINSIVNDPLTMFFIGVGIVLPWLIKSIDIRLKVLSLSICAYLLYVLSIGGDFMSGRFFSIPLVCALIVIITIAKSFTNQPLLILIGLALLLGFSIPWNTLTLNTAETSLGNNIIADERIYYFQSTGLIYQLDYRAGHDFIWETMGKDFKQRGIKVTAAKAIGMFGYYAGPGVFIVDQEALADPLLSHLPPQIEPTFHPGHLDRSVPDGYMETLRSGSNLITNKNIAEYYEKVKMITRGEIFNLERISTIIQMNLGKYNYLLN